jgi:hypothetical protein
MEDSSQQYQQNLKKKLRPSEEGMTAEQSANVK